MTTPQNLPARSKPDPIDWYTPHEVGNMAGGFSAQFIREEIAAGQLRAEYCLSKRPGSKVGRWRIRKEDALAYVEQLRTQALQASHAVNTTI